jgi:hypothetical protein
MEDVPDRAGPTLQAKYKPDASGPASLLPGVEDANPAIMGQPDWPGRQEKTHHDMAALAKSL